MTPSEAATVLGVGLDASVGDVQRAFVGVSRKVHPDLLVDATDEDRHAAGIRFGEACRARDVLLATHPVIPVRFDYSREPTRRRGISGSIIVLLLLAAALVASVTMADAYRSSTVENPRGVVSETP